MKILKIIALPVLALSFAALSSCGCCVNEDPPIPLGPAPYSAPVMEIEPTK